MEWEGTRAVVKVPLIIRNSMGFYPEILKEGVYNIYKCLILNGKRKNRIFFIVGGSDFSLGFFPEELKLAEKSGMIEIGKEN